MPDAHSAPRKLKMAALAGQIARAKPVTTLDLSTRQLAVGDPITAEHTPLDLGVEQVAMLLGSVKDEPVLIARVGSGRVVRWSHAHNAGVDSGVLGMWDPQRPATGELDAENLDLTGLEYLLGRPVYCLTTGDGGFPCVLGHDEDGSISAVLTGPGVRDISRFGLGE